MGKDIYLACAKISAANNDDRYRRDMQEVKPVERWGH